MKAMLMFFMYAMTVIGLKKFTMITLKKVMEASNFVHAVWCFSMRKNVKKNMKKNVNDI